MNNRRNVPWHQPENWQWQRERRPQSSRGRQVWRGRGGQSSRDGEKGRRVREPWRHREYSPPQRKPLSLPQRSSRGDSSDEEARAERQRTTNIVKNKLQSLTAEDKSKSIKKLLDAQANLGSISKDARDSKSGEKESKRIAHVRKPIRPVPPPPPPPRLLSVHLGEEFVKSQEASEQLVQENIKRKLLQDLLVMPISELKVMVNSPKSNDNLFLSHLMKETRSLLSDAMRKLAEHKLHIGKEESSQMLVELENLVDPDIAVDVCRMPIETIQALRDIFNLNLDGDFDLLNSPATNRSSDVLSPNIKYENLFSDNQTSSCFQWHTPQSPATEMFLSSAQSQINGNMLIPLNTNQPLPVPPPAGYVGASSFMSHVYSYSDNLLMNPAMSLPNQPIEPPVSFINTPPSIDVISNKVDATEKYSPQQQANDLRDSSSKSVIVPDVGTVLEGINDIVKKLEEAKNVQIDLLKRRGCSPQLPKTITSNQPSLESCSPPTNEYAIDAQSVSLISPGFKIQERADNVQKPVINHATHSLPLSEKIKNMADIRKKVEIKKHKKQKKEKHKSNCVSLVSDNTQTEKIIEKNDYSQTSGPKKLHSSVYCQTPQKSFKNNQMQTERLFHNLLTVSTQTQPCAKSSDSKNAETQTERLESREEQSSQTENINMVDRETQHILLYSHRGEQVNRSFFTSNKYAQTSLKNLNLSHPSLKENKDKKVTKNNVSGHNKNCKKNLVDPKSNTSGIALSNSNIGRVEQDLLTAEFHSFQEDVRALGGESPLRRHLVSTMLNLMDSTFHNFYQLFSDEKLWATTQSKINGSSSQERICINSKRAIKEEKHDQQPGVTQSTKNHVEIIGKKRHGSRSPCQELRKSNASKFKKLKLHSEHREAVKNSVAQKKKDIVISDGKNLFAIEEKQIISKTNNKEANILGERNEPGCDEEFKELPREKFANSDLSDCNAVEVMESTKRECLSSQGEVVIATSGSTINECIKYVQCAEEVKLEAMDHKIALEEEPPLFTELTTSYEWYKKKFKLRECSVKCLLPKTCISFDTPQKSPKSPVLTTRDIDYHISPSERPPTPTIIAKDDVSYESQEESPSALDGHTKANSTVSDSALFDQGEENVDGKKKIIIGPIEFQGHGNNVVDFKVSGNHLLAACGDAVHCFSLRSGKRKRVYKESGTSVQCLSVLPKKEGEVVYSAGKDQMVRAFSVQDSSLLRCSNQLGALPLCLNTISTAAVEKRGLYTGLDNGEVLSLNPKTLKVLQRFRIGKAPVISVLATELEENRVLIASTADCQLLIREINIGDLQQNLDWKFSSPAETCIYHNENLYCSSKLPDLILFNFNKDSGWSGPTRIITSPNMVGLSISEESLFVGSRSGTVFVIDTKSQTVQTEFTLESNLTGIGIHKKLVVASYDGGKLVALPLPQRVRKILQ